VVLVMSDEASKHREIRSFVLRTGRLTKAQQRALDELWPRFGIEADQPIADLQSLFPSVQPLVLEIGTGNGNALAAYAQAAPEKNYIGVEVHTPGVGHLLLKVEEFALTCVRVAKHDAVQLLRKQIPEQSLDEVRIWFPDPWHKARHHKRRLIQPAFVELLASKLKPNGILHLATDWQPYAEHMLAVLTASTSFANTVTGSDFADRPEWRPLTHFEKRGQRLGHGVWDLIFKRSADHA
jgi:tRNA (guanine-N7-)-methyltransferase